MLTGVLAGVAGCFGVLEPELAPEAEGVTGKPMISLMESGNLLGALSCRKIPSAFFKVSSNWMANVISLIC